MNRLDLFYLLTCFDDILDRNNIVIHTQIEKLYIKIDLRSLFDFKFEFVFAFE